MLELHLALDPVRTTTFYPKQFAIQRVFVKLGETKWSFQGTHPDHFEGTHASFSRKEVKN